MASNRPSGFQFINFQNLDDMRDSETISQIRRHAMKDVGASRRQVNSRRSRRQQRLMPNPGPDQSSNTAEELEVLQERTAETDEAYGQTTHMNAYPVQWAADSADLAIQATAAYHRSSGVSVAALPRPPARASPAAIGPFLSAPVPMDEPTCILVNYFLYHFHQNANWVHELDRPHDQQVLRRYITEHVEIAFTDSFAMYCLLTAAASRMRYRDNVRHAGIEAKKDEAMYLALRALRSRIENVDTSDVEYVVQLVFCIKQLGSAEGYDGNLPAARAHVAAIAELVRSIGGLSMVRNEYTRGSLVAFDVLLSCEMMLPCLLGHTCDPGSATTNPDLSPVLSELYQEEHPTGLGFLEKDGGLVPQSVRVSIERLVEIEMLRTHLEAGSPRETDGAIYRWICLRTAATRSMLLALVVEDPAIEAMRIVLVMYTLLTDHDPTRARCLTSMSGTLRAILESCTENAWAERREICFWILLMGFCCAQDGTEDMHWYTTSVQRLWASGAVTIPRDATYKAVLRALLDMQHRFFYCADVQQVPMDKLASVLQQSPLAMHADHK